MIGKKVHYSGTVQGVGFRYTTRSLAEGYAVGGYVRNLRDGRVELVAEGEADEVDAFLNAVQQRMAAYIESSEVVETEVEGLTTFSIRV